VCAKVSLVSAGAPRHGPALPAWRLTPGLFCVAHCLCFWRALGQSAQAEQDTPILCSKQESVVRRVLQIMLILIQKVFCCLDIGQSIVSVKNSFQYSLLLHTAVNTSQLVTHGGRRFRQRCRPFNVRSRWHRPVVVAPLPAWRDQGAKEPKPRIRIFSYFSIRYACITRYRLSHLCCGCEILSVPTM